MPTGLGRFYTIAERREQIWLNLPVSGEASRNDLRLHFGLPALSEAKSFAGVTIASRSLACSVSGMSRRSRSLVTRNLALPDRAVAIRRLSSGSRLNVGRGPRLTNVTVCLR